MTSTTHHGEKLTGPQKAAVLEAYQESLRDEGADAIQALEEIRAARGFPGWEEPPVRKDSTEQEEPGRLSEEMRREILHSYNEALRDEVVDALTAIEDIRRRHSL